MSTLPWTRSRTWRADDRTKLGTLLVNAALTAGFFALAVAPLVLRMAWESTKVLAIQRTLARVLGVVYALDRTRPNFVNVQIPPLTIVAFPSAVFRTAAHWLIAQFNAYSGGGILEASNLF